MVVQRRLTQFDALSGVGNESRLNTRDVGTELLRSLVAVVEEDSYTKAALRLGISQPAVSSHIKRLQEHLGAELFDKRTPGVKLTQQGEIVLGHARKILRLHDNLVRQIAQADMSDMRLRVGASSVLAHSAVMAALSELRGRHPDVNLYFHREMSTRQIVLLNSGELDICLSVSMAPPRDEAAIYWKVPIVWVAARELAEPLAFPLNVIAHGASHVSANEMVSVLSEAGVDYRIVMKTNDADSSIQAARNGIGITYLMLSKTIPPFLKILDARRSGLPPLTSAYWGIYINPETRSALTDELARLIAKALAPDDAEIFSR